MRQAMPIRQGVTPVCSIGHGADPMGLGDSASLHLQSSQLRTCRCIGSTRKRGERANRKLFLCPALPLLLGFANGQYASFGPVFLGQRNHRSIDTQCTALQMVLLVFLLWFRCFPFRRVRLLHPPSCPLTHSAHRLLIGLDSTHPFGHACCVVEGHPRSQMHHMLLLSGGQMSGESPSCFIQGEKDLPYTWGTFRTFAGASRMLLHVPARSACVDLWQRGRSCMWDTGGLDSPMSFPTHDSDVSAPPFRYSALPAASCSSAPPLLSPHTSLGDGLSAIPFSLSGCLHSV